MIFSLSTAEERASKARGGQPLCLMSCRADCCTAGCRVDCTHSWLWSGKDLCELRAGKSSKQGSQLCCRQLVGSAAQPPRRAITCLPCGLYRIGRVHCVS